MNLYSIDFSHTGPKDQMDGITCLLLAETDEQVYEWIASEPKIKERSMFNSWKEREEEEEEETSEDHDDDYTEVEYETFKEKIIRMKGEMNDEDFDYTDAYYGVTLYGWELLKENVTTDYTELIELGVMYRADSKK